MTEYATPNINAVRYKSKQKNNRKIHKRKSYRIAISWEKKREKKNE